MPRSRPFPSAIALLLTLALGFSVLTPPATAQFGGRGMGAKPVDPGLQTLKQPEAHRVYQRGKDGKAEVAITLPDAGRLFKITDARISGAGGMGMGMVFGTKFVDGKLVGVPVGGPYTVTCRIEKDGTVYSATSGLFFVGDLWVLAGQSNMEGVGNLLDVTPPHAKVMLLGMDGKWAQAEEPLHWLVDSPDPVHSGDPKTQAERSASTHKTRTKGAGLGLPFAVALTEATGIPIGLVATAHGGTSMGQWDPAKKEQGGNSLYGSMLRSIQLAGGKVKGVLWYQGESDAMGSAETWKAYGKVFSNFIGSVRQDLGQSELPFYFVQLGRFVNGSDPQGWNSVRDTQRLLPERIPNTAVISVVDLELDDGIHVGTQGLKVAGQRLARIAERELFGKVGATTPTLDRVNKSGARTLVVKFKGVNMGTPNTRMGAGGGTGGMMGFGGGMGMSRAGGMAQPTGSSGSSESNGLGLKPEHHIAGFSIHSEDGTNVPLIYEASIGTARDTVILELNSPVPPKSSLYYGYGLDPYCNLTDGLDMGVAAFGPIALDDLEPATAPTASAPKSAATAPKTVMAPKPPAAPVALALATPKPATPTSKPAATAKPPVKLLLITGDNGSYHPWKVTTAAFESALAKSGRIDVKVTTTPGKDLTAENLAKFDVFLLNYKDTPDGAPDTRWSDANKAAFLKAIEGGKGLVVIHHSSSAFTKPNWPEFEKAVAGGWRTQGNHGPAHQFTVKKTAVKHAISAALPDHFDHVTDELYQNCMLLPGTEVLATAYSDPGKPKGTGKDEAVIWVNHFGKGRVFENVLGHDAAAISDPNYQAWLSKGAIWAATGSAD
jgi:type 1 glutamine amidotransferase